MRNIVVVPYSPEWPAEFAAEARRLEVAMAPVLVELHHIGSTSVPGLAAKPLIDILAVVCTVEGLDECNEAMVALGYEPKGEFGIAGRRFFSKGSDEHRTHHVHAFAVGDPAIDAHLAFRDYLRTHPHEARRYGELKAALAERHRNDIDAYMDGKAPLIQEMLKHARRGPPA
ncbi:MAG: GrpB family protein [Planctomycetes bacterium]|nr:GrpB family protein [Planctomycetota bacterium]